jgi:hypothetical protein
MRKLETDDMFLLSEILDKMEYNVNFSKDTTQEQLGVEMLIQLSRKAYKAKDEIKTFIANVTGKSTDEVSKMPIKELIKTLKNILQQDGVMDFLQ